MASRFEIKVDATEVVKLAASLGNYDPASLGAASLPAVNEITRQAYEDARGKMIAGINLTDEYLQRQMEFVPATSAAHPVASIKARGTVSNLISYRPLQNSVAVRFPNSVIAPLVKRAGPNPRKPGALLPWKLRKGAPALGIPVDRKQAGLTVEVTRGAAKPISYAFVIRGHGHIFVGARGKDDHKGKGKVKALAAPSVYQLFRHALDPTFLQGVQDSLSNSIVSIAEADIKKAFG